MREYTPIEQLLSRYKLNAGEQFEEIASLAWRVQHHRSETGNSRLAIGEGVSRTSLFYACVELNPEIQTQLQKTQFDYQAFCQESGLSGYKDDATVKHGTVAVSEQMDHGLERYAADFPNRPAVGAWELLYSVVVIGGGTFEERFVKSHGDLSIVTHLIRDSIVGSDENSHSTAVIDIARFKQEKHVRSAILLALNLADDSPVDAANLLEAANITAKSTKSKAFSRLAELLKTERTAETTAVTLPSALPVSNGLAESYSVAVPYLEAQKTVWGRDFVTLALLSVNDPSLDSIAEQAGTSLKSIRDEWFRFVTSDERHRTPEMWSAWWQAAGVEVPDNIADESKVKSKAPDPDAPPVPTPTPSVLSPFITTDAVPQRRLKSDFRPSRHDSLDLKSQAKIFSSLLIARNVQPPFALGLFGDWGVGKTFFMRLMQEHVEMVAGRTAKAERDADSVARVAQIEFNAWHFVDSDLWASMASHIFDELSIELSDKPDEIQEIRRRLRKTIDSSQREQEEAKAAIETAKESRRDAATNLDSLKRKRQQAAKKCEPLRLERVWKAVLKVPGFEKLRSGAEATANRFGVDVSIDSVETAQKTYQSLRDIRRRVFGLEVAFFEQFKGWRAVLSLLVIAAILVLTAFWPELLSLGGDRLSALLTPVLRLATLIAPPVAWAASRTHELSSVLGILEDFNREIRAPSEPLEEPSCAEKKLQAELDRLDANIAADQQRIEEADQQIAAAQAEIQRINSGGLVYDFLEGKVRDSRYLDRLGLITVIRRDFEKLGKLLQDWSEHDEAEQPDADTNKQAEPKTPPIDRIVLYIDDLDRCSPDRVVEVLQAVHLLLAFDLFVVVLAVDARWLERSLNEVYNSPRKASAISLPQESLHKFSAHEYLEKIFQIPFSLPRMDDDGFCSLVADMIAVARRAANAAKQPQTTKLSSDAALSEQAGQPAKQFDPKHTPPKVPEDSDGGPEDESQGSLPPIQNDAGTPDTNAELRAAEHDAAQQLQELKEAEERIAAMLLTPPETEFVACLFSFIKTPRLVKRFLNIYSLIRVRASEIESEFSEFTDRETGEYRAVLLLLAICVGLPDDAPSLLMSLEQSNDADAGDDEPHDEENTEFENWIVGETSRTSRHPDLYATILGIKQKLEKKGAPALEGRLEPYRDWAREVGRYSFHWRLNSIE